MNFKKGIIVFFLSICVVRGIYLCDSEECVCTNHKIICRQIDPFDFEMYANSRFIHLDFQGCRINEVNTATLQLYYKLQILDIRRFSSRSTFQCINLPRNVNFTILSDCDKKAKTDISYSKVSSTPANQIISSSSSSIPGGIMSENLTGTTPRPTQIQEKKTIPFVSRFIPLNSTTFLNFSKHLTPTTPWSVNGSIILPTPSIVRPREEKPIKLNKGQIILCFIGALFGILLCAFIVGSIMRKKCKSSNRRRFTENIIYRDINMSILNIDSIGQTIDENEGMADSDGDDLPEIRL